MNKETLIYVYDIFQAEFMIKEIQAEGFYRIGKGTQGDICVSFFDTEKVKQAMNKWSEKARKLKTN
jgi:uncharacterized protein (DUF1919 family)